jgi:hypothetical protein
MPPAIEAAPPAPASTPAAPSLSEAMNQHLTPPAKEAAPPAEKPAAKPATEQPAAKKSPFDRLKSVEEPAAEEPAKPEDAKPTDAAPAEAEETAPKGLTPEAQKAWTEGKRAKKELARVKPEYEKLKAEVEQLRTQKPQVPEEITKELEDHRQFRAAHDWKNREEYQNEVVKPMQKHWSDVREVVDYLGVDATAVERAMLETNRLRRNELIKQALSTSEKELDPQAVSDVCSAANALHEVDAKAQKMEREALELQNVLKGKQEQETAKQKEARELAFSKASNEVATLFETKLAPVLKDKPEVAKALREARIAEDPMDQAYQAQSAALLPEVVEAYIALRNELAEIKKKTQARTAARPTLNGHTPPPASQEQQVSLKEAAAAHFSTRA